MGSLSIGKRRIAFDDFNPGGDAIPVVFLHAFPLNRRMWDSQAAALRSTFRVIRIDLRGHGESEVPDDDVTIEGMAHDVHDVLESLNALPAVIVGLSMGGYVAFEFWRHYAGSVLALVLADTRATADTEDGRKARYALIEEIDDIGASVVADRMLPKLLARASAEALPDLVSRIRGWIDMTPAHSIKAALHALASRRDSTDLLAGINVPVLVIVGDEDTLTPPADSKELAAAIPGAKFRVIEHAGHLANLERSAEFTRAVLAFLEGLVDA